MDEVLLALPADIAKAHPSYSMTLEFEDLPEDEEGLFVFGNQALLATSIRNIVLNACKYSDNHRARVVLRLNGSRLEVSVHNSGKEIPKEEIDNIFQPFYRIEENRTAGGFGLGLSLAQRIVKLHKGAIYVQSGKDHETVFTIHLPAAYSLKSFAF